MNSKQFVKQGDKSFKSKSFSKAVTNYNKAINENPENKVAWNNKGLALTKLKRYNEAITAYRKAIEIDENYQLPSKNLKKLDKRLGKSEKMEKTNKQIEFTGKQNNNLVKSEKEDETNNVKPQESEIEKTLKEETDDHKKTWDAENKSSLRKTDKGGKTKEKIKISENDETELAENGKSEIGKNDETELIENDKSEIAENDETESAENDKSEIAENDETELVENNESELAENTGTGIAEDGKKEAADNDKILDNLGKSTETESKLREKPKPTKYPDETEESGIENSKKISPQIPEKEIPESEQTQEDFMENFLKGNRRMNELKTDEAIEFYKKASYADPNSANVIINIGVAHIRKENYLNAVEYFDEALNINPGNKLAEEYRNNALLLQRKKDGEQLLKCPSCGGFFPVGEIKEDVIRCPYCMVEGQMENSDNQN